MAISSGEEDDVTESLAWMSDTEERNPPSTVDAKPSGRLKSVSRGQKSQRSAPATALGRSPQKPASKPSKVPKSTGNPTTKNEKPKSKGTIQSFFNNAANRLPRSPASVSPSKPSTPLEQPEVIDSDDDKAVSVTFSKGSNTALAARKRKAQHVDNGQGDILNDGQLPTASQKFRKVGDSGQTSSFAVFNDDTRPWSEQFAPAKLDELAVHKRKVADVRTWLQTVFHGKRQRVLILKGAAGTGKTATLKLLAQDFGVNVMEWRNPAGNHYASETAQSAAAQFEDFIGRSGKTSGLMLVADPEEQSTNVPAFVDDVYQMAGKQLLLVEEFPNTFSRTSPGLQSFRSAIAQYLVSPPAVSRVSPIPLILIISETLLSTSTAAADSFTVHRLLGPELVNHPYIDIIEFNAVAPTILLKALESIVVKEARISGRRKTPGPLVLKRLAESGDIRSAVSSLEFLCLRGDDGDAWSSKVAFTKPKKKSEPPLTEAEKEALLLISNRESSLGIFHSVGKIVYNKRVDPASGADLAHPSAWLPQHRRMKVPENDVNRLIDEIGTDTATFIAALHENYALSCSGSTHEESLDSMFGCAESLSDSDLISIDRFSFGSRAASGTATDALRQDEMSFQLAVRGLLFNLPVEVHRLVPASGRRTDAHRMFYPTSLKLWRRREEVEGMLESLTEKLRDSKIHQLASKTETPVANGLSGVAGWTRVSRHSPDMPTGAIQDEETFDTPSSSTAKTENLIERLPYIANIIQGRAASEIPTGLLDQILSVTRITSEIVETKEEETEEDADAAGEPSAVLATEQWSTDRPDDSHTPKATRHPIQKSKGPRKLIEAERPRWPIEYDVAKLVLENDDIVDY